MECFMGRIAEFTDENIINAGLSLQKNNKPVSPFSIRNKIGGGSSERIKEVWNIYLKAQPELMESDDIAVELPTEIQENLDRNIKHAIKNIENITANNFKVAQEIAEKRVSSTINEYKVKVDDFEESEQQASIALENCDLKITILNDELDLEKQRNEELVAENAKLEGVLSSTNDSVAKLEIKSVELNKLILEHGKLIGKYELLEHQMKKN